MRCVLGGGSGCVRDRRAGRERQDRLVVPPGPREQETDVVCTRVTRSVENALGD